MASTEFEEGDPAAFAFWLRFWGRAIAALEVVGGLTGLYTVAFGTMDDLGWKRHPRKMPLLIAMALGCAMVIMLASTPSAVRAQSAKAAASSYGMHVHHFTSQADLDESVARLEQPATRLEALSELVEFCWIKLYNPNLHMMAHDPKIAVLEDEAVTATRKYQDYRTVSQALDSEDPTLQFWGVWFWRGGAFTPLHGKPVAWLGLLPKVKRLAIVGDANVRLQALEQLAPLPQEQSFLTWRLTVETDPFNILDLLDTLKHDDGPKLSVDVTPYLLRFLNAPDRNVRLNALSFIESNHNSAPMWQVKFDQSVVDRIKEMQASGSPEEKKAASRALQGMTEKPQLPGY